MSTRWLTVLAVTALAAVPSPQGIRAQAPQNLPDLIVTDIFVEQGEIKFRVKNIGRGTKVAETPVQYRLIIWAGPRANIVEGMAGATTARELRPGGEVADSTGVAVNQPSSDPRGKPGIGAESGPEREAVSITDPQTVVEVIVNPGGNLPESDAYNNSRRATWGELSGHRRLQIVGGYVLVGGGIAGVVQVKNAGTQPLRDSVLEVTVAGEPQQKVTATRRIALLNPGESFAADFREVGAGETPACADPRACRASARVMLSSAIDTEVDIVELRPVADLVALGGYFIVDYRSRGVVMIRNVGLTPATNFTVRLTVSEAAVRIPDVRVSRLDPGRSQRVEFDLGDDPGLVERFGTYRVSVEVDPDRAIPEVNKENNFLWITDIRRQF